MLVGPAGGRQPCAPLRREDQHFRQVIGMNQREPRLGKTGRQMYAESGYGTKQGKTHPVVLAEDDRWTDDGYRHTVGEGLGHPLAGPLAVSVV